MPIEQILEVSHTPTVLVERVSGRLIIRAWDEPRVRLRGSGSDDRFGQENDTVTLSADGMTQLWVPEQTVLQIDRVDSDLHVQGVGGTLTVERVSGHALLEDCGPVTLNRVYGHLIIRRCSGSVAVDRINGNAGIDEVGGALSIGRCNGNLNVHGVVDALTAQVDGNVTLRLLPLPAGEVNVEARGNIRARLPVEGPFAVRAEANGRVRVSGLPGIAVQSTNVAAFRVGEGGPTLTLSARGNIDLRGVTPEDELELDFEISPVEISPDVSQEIAERAAAAVEQVAEQLESQMEALARRLDEQLARLGSGDELAGKIQEKIQRAMRRAEDAVNRATQRATEREARRDDRRLRSVPTPPMPPTPPAPPRPPKRSPVTSEERMRILRMVEEGKLSVEQAEMLLAALNR